MKKRIMLVAELLGLCSIVTGVALVSLPAAFIVGGAAVVGVVEARA